MLSAPAITWRTAASIARLVAVLSIRERVSTGRPRISGGKSHSCEMPIRPAAAPSAHTISVADGKSDAIRSMAATRSAASAGGRRRADAGHDDLEQLLAARAERAGGGEQVVLPAPVERVAVAGAQLGPRGVEVVPPRE